MPTPPVRDRIFVSYRRRDEPNAARGIADRLADKFGPDQVYFDVDSIRAGEDWEKGIAGALARTRFAVVVIGPKWLSLFSGRASRQPDYVLAEIKAALSCREVEVIPVTVNRAPIPTADELPAEITTLASRQAVELRHTRFNEDVQAEIVQPILADLQPRPRPLLTETVRVPLGLFGGMPSEKTVQRVILERAESGWQVTDRGYKGGLFGFNGGIVLTFQKKAERER